jgi:hypothetical protein
LQSRFVFNATELQKFYVHCSLKKSPRVTVRQFHDRIHARLGQESSRNRNANQNFDLVLVISGVYDYQRSLMLSN